MNTVYKNILYDFVADSKLYYLFCNWQTFYANALTNNNSHKQKCGIYTQSICIITNWNGTKVLIMRENQRWPEQTNGQTDERTDGIWRQLLAAIYYKNKNTSRQASETDLFWSLLITDGMPWFCIPHRGRAYTIL